MISSADKFKLNRMNRTAWDVKLGDELLLASGAQFKGDDCVYFVDASRTNGAGVSESGDGSSWDQAFITIQEGVNAARYTKGTTTINSDKDRNKYVFVAPGQYNEQVLFSGYNIHVIGTQPINCNNGDYGVVINYDGAIASTCVVGFTGAGIELANLFINNAEAIPSLYVPSPGDGCWVHDCFINGDETNATYGIQWTDCRNSVIENNKIMGHVTAEIYVGGSGAWFRNSSINNNHISSGATKGIHIDGSTICGAGDSSMIKDNVVIGNGTTGIHQDSASASIMVIGNYTSKDWTTDITDDGGDAINNFAGA